MVEAGANTGFVDALRQARAAQSAHFEALYTLRDAKALRLQILNDEIAPFVAASHGAIELVLAPGDIPRLWIDLVTFVIMEPDPKTYRLVQHGETGREIILETADRAEMVRQVKAILIHGVIALKRRDEGWRLTPGKGRRYSAGSLVFAWLGGLGIGVAASFAAVICLQMLEF